MMKKSLIIMATLLLAMTNIAVMAQEKTYEKRADVPEEYKWNLQDIYESWEAWETDLASVQQMMDEVVSFKGKLAGSKENFKKVVVMQSDMIKIAMKLYSYPSLMKAVESANPEVSNRLQQVQYMFAKYSTTMSWYTPELLTIPEQTMMTWIEGDEILHDYKFSMQKMYRSQEHVLDPQMETLLSYFSQVSGAPSTIYNELSNSDIQYGEVTLSDGTTVKATPGTSAQILSYNQNQEDRRKVSEAMYSVYETNKHTYASIYNAVCQSDWASAQARNYKSTLEASLHGDNIPEEVYTNMIKSVKENVAPLQKYLKLRAKALGLEGNYHRYDGSIALTDSEIKYPYEEAKKNVLKSIEPLGKDYGKKMKQAMSEGWLDVYEYEGKRQGAFSAGVYGVHPYMLLNYSETMNDMFTLAHELGHTMHTLLANENQPYATHSYTIFVAEVASTFNERLLLEYMLENTKDPHERIALLTQAIDNIVGTFYIQCLFADYELQVHQMVEKGMPVTADALSGVFRDLFKSYYGDMVITDDFYDVIWARIHHFYGKSYYVYQYATCFASSAKLYDDMMAAEDKKMAVENYLGLLKSGGNDYPMNQLKKVGVDLTKEETIQSVINQLDVMVDRLEKELEKI